jgi:hypothetical protein
MVTTDRLIYGIWPVGMQTSLYSGAMHHARFISDNTNPIKMKVNIKYICLARTAQ